VGDVVNGVSVPFLHRWLQCLFAGRLTSHANA
jgi:hypothetical protein